MNYTSSFVSSIAIGITLSSLTFAETVGIFFDQDVKQIQFAANDIKTALEKKDFTVEMLPLESMNPSYANKKVVISIAADEAVTKS